jgi:16S rRNA (guanine966-N2)-methyltransferase
MRVIAGKYRSRTLRSLRGLDVRPTSDRLRETLFDVLTAGNPSALEGSVWFDLFAGTGAVGIEALSRGAGRVYFVDAAASAAQLIRTNLHALGIEQGFEVLRQDAAHALDSLRTRGVTVDYVFLDPPYRLQDQYQDVLEKVSKLKLLKPGGVAIAEHLKKFDPGERFGELARYRLLKQGDSALSFYREG